AAAFATGGSTNAILHLQDNTGALTAFVLATSNGQSNFLQYANVSKGGQSLARRAANLIIPAGVYTEILMDTTDYDPAGNMSGGRFVAPVNGVYLFVFRVSYIVTAIGEVVLALGINGALARQLI